MFLPLRPALAMIELIFALVIIAIVIMSTPQLISQANKSTYSTMQQEAIASIASHMSFILSRPWDEANVLQKNNTSILQTDTNIKVHLNAINILNIPCRGGTPTHGIHRSFQDEVGKSFFASAIGKDTNDDSLMMNDIDDYHNTVTTLRSVDNKKNKMGDYIDTKMTISTYVHYVNDAPTNSNNTFDSHVNILRYNIPKSTDFPLFSITSNIKWITSILKTRKVEKDSTLKELDKNIILHAFSCNIGGYTLEDKTL